MPFELSLFAHAVLFTTKLYSLSAFSSPHSTGVYDNNLAHCWHNGRHSPAS